MVGPREDKGRDLSASLGPILVTLSVGEGRRGGSSIHRSED